jgi:hypothetical protein
MVRYNANIRFTEHREYYDDYNLYPDLLWNRRLGQPIGDGYGQCSTTTDIFNASSSREYGSREIRSN